MSATADTAGLFDLTGKVVIVTGSTKGIGRAMVEGLARGGRVGRREQPQAGPLRRGGRGSGGARPERTCSGSRATSGSGTPIPAFVDGVLERFGRIDGLVNNAGINPARIGPADMTLDYWRKVFSVNLEGPLRTSQCVLPTMREQGGGSIVNIGTMAAYSGGANICAYGSSKAALLNLTKSMAMDWAQWNVRVQHALAGPVHERDDGGRREDPARLPRPRRRRHVHEAHRRSGRRSSARSATW